MGMNVASLGAVLKSIVEKAAMDDNRDLLLHAIDTARLAVLENPNARHDQTICGIAALVPPLTGATPQIGPHAPDDSGFDLGHVPLNPL
jgi:hypothetical protein